MDGKVDYLTGLYYFRERGWGVTDFRFGAVFGSVRQPSYGVGANCSKSALAHVQYHLDDRTTLQAGACYTIDDKDLTSPAVRGAWRDAPWLSSLSVNSTKWYLYSYNRSNGDRRMPIGWRARSRRAEAWLAVRYGGRALG